ncbi:hypothetical protein F2P81_023459 [Scophthalmus maximus]|uniref:Uncharacterized protein n=1 Tax=Scophthalmus maximus TaxID=52904 RepID=A0A6A4RW86_SCOMX|nr:hypothetical protein F2P81_023459 [Scophthalmus maximus]
MRTTSEGKDREDRQMKRVSRSLEMRHRRVVLSVLRQSHVHLQIMHTHNFMVNHLIVATDAVVPKVSRGVTVTVTRSAFRSFTNFIIKSDLLNTDEQPLRMMEHRNVYVARTTRQTQSADGGRVIRSKSKCAHVQ